MKRSLTLRREALTDLTSDDLTGVAGAAPLPYSNDQITCPGITRCVDLSRLVTFRSCVTAGVR